MPVRVWERHRAVRGHALGAGPVQAVNSHPDGGIREERHLKSAYGSVENTGVNVPRDLERRNWMFSGNGYFSKIVAPGPFVAIIEPGSRRRPARGRSMSVSLGRCCGRPAGARGLR